MQDGEYPCLRESEGNTVKSSTNDQTGEHIFTTSMLFRSYAGDCSGHKAIWCLYADRTRSSKYIYISNCVLVVSLSLSPPISPENFLTLIAEPRKLISDLHENELDAEE